MAKQVIWQDDAKAVGKCRSKGYALRVLAIKGTTVTLHSAEQQSIDPPSCRARLCDIRGAASRS